MIHESIFDLIGNTPIIKFQGIFVKLESFNLAGSIKDRVAYQMIENLIENGSIKKDSTIIEVTSGNTGIAIAMICAIKHLKCKILMLDNVSEEKIHILKAYGADVILTPTNLGMPYAFEIAKKLAREKGYIYLDQFSNMQNILAHRKTAKEIINDFSRANLKPDYLISGIGTGGTITGISKVLKKVYPQLKVIGVEPKETPFFTRLKKQVDLSEIMAQIKPNGIQGIGSTFKPDIIDLDIIDQIETVSTEETYQKYYELGQQGLLLGLSSCASMIVANRIQKEDSTKNILMISADNGLKYLGSFDA